MVDVMMRQISHSDIVNAVRTVLPAATTLIVFGSRAEGTARADSDLDLAVMQPGPGDQVKLWEAGEAIAARLNIDVDLVDLRTANTVLQWQIISTGRHLFGQAEAEGYEAFIAGQMMELNEARAPLIAEIEREGRVHG